jgi:hypothetical protein
MPEHSQDPSPTDGVDSKRLQAELCARARFGRFRFAGEHFADGGEHLEVVAENFESHRDRHREEDADDAPDPAPE